MKLLTRRKQAWLDRRKTELIKGNVITAPAAVERRYLEKLDALIRRMTTETESQIKKLFETEHAEEYFAQDASVASQARILTNALLRRFNTLFADHSRPIAEAFANQGDAANSAAIHESLKQISGGLSLGVRELTPDMREVMNATITENVGLIRTIPQQYLNAVQGAVMRSVTNGNGLQDLVPFLQKHKDITYKRARFIALDQNRKLSSNLSRERMEKVGLTEFIWRHTGGSQEPRRLHEEMDGKTYSFDDPPVIDKKTGERGFPGQLPGCKCRYQMVLKISGD